MNWYVAKVIFQIRPGERTTRSQFDEHIRLIAAENEEEAFLKARILGLQEEATFLNQQQKSVSWDFVNVAELIPVEELKDGQELYSHIFETEEAGDYIHNVHQRASALQLGTRS